MKNTVSVNVYQLFYLGGAGERGGERRGGNVGTFHHLF